MKISRLTPPLVKFLLVIGFLISPAVCSAMPPGTLLYRTSGDGKMFGYSQDPLVYSEKGIVKDIYAGHAAIYIGKINGEDYIVEALGGGIVRTPAKYFVNRAANETFLGARLPRGLTALEQAKVVALAKNLAGRNFGYDLDLQHQKGPGDGEWSCTGLTEKLYESANIANPNNLAALEYDPNYYAVDITPDGYDNYSVVNSQGDCFSREREFSKIARRRNIYLPAPELIGFDLGLEHNGERYVFLPYTQFVQPTLEPIAADVEISSSFSTTDIRGPLNVKLLVLRWSLINNPLSSIKNVAVKIKEAAVKLADQLFGSQPESALVLEESDLKNSAVKAAALAAARPSVVVNRNTAVKNSSAETAVKNETKSASPGAAARPAVMVRTKVAGSATAEAAEIKAVASNQTSSAPSVVYNPTTVKTNSTAATIAAVNSPSPSQPSINSQTNSLNTSATHSSIDDSPKLARINKIYGTGDNDWVELINPTNYDFDLAEAGYRLEKAKSAEDPSLIMRLGNTADGSYPRGTIIKAQGKYLIVRDDANNYYRSRASAIATRQEFSWSGSGYTLYLGTDAISASNDPDIMEAVGFGPDATYFQGNAPALEITDNYILNRLAANGNNQGDFNLIKSDDPGLDWSVASSTSETATSTDPTTGDENATSTEITAQPESVSLNKIYSTGTNDWVELFNFGDQDLDLATAGIRLEKTKTAQDPSLIMRLGDAADGVYPGGTVIRAHDNYLIVRAEADSYYKNQADALATRDEFSWTGDDYTLYLGQDAISSSTDPDIIDAVGFGPGATYYLGSNPALAITDNYILWRRARTNNNSSDFELRLSDDPTIATSSTAAAYHDLFVAPTPIDSAGLSDTWHFDECFGAGSRAVGRWGCAGEVAYNLPKFTGVLNSALRLNNSSLSFYYKSSSGFPRVAVNLSNSGGDKIALILDPGMITVEGLPNSAWRYYQSLPFDDIWHQATLVVNQSSDYWSVYIDGVEIIKENFFANLPIMTDLTVDGNNGKALIDELAFWNRSLTPTEIQADYLIAAPYNPLTPREPQVAAEWRHAWEFAEDAGSTAADSIGSAILNVNPNSWSGRRHNDYALTVSDGNNFNATLTPLISSDLSLDFWWRNSAYPNGGRTDAYLTDGENDNIRLFGLQADYYRIGAWLNGRYLIVSEGVDKTIPNDDLWHHLVLVYDSYRYKLRFYVDGEEKASSSEIGLPSSTSIGQLVLSSNNFQAQVDALGLWTGALSPQRIKEIYTNNK